MLAFLLNYQVEPKMNKPYTHSSYNGSLWNIPNDKLDVFYGLYTQYLNNMDSCDGYPSIVEYHTNMSCSPITIDIDIKQTIKKRQLNDIILKEIYDEFKGYLDEIFINDANYTCYMLMRNKPYLDQKSGLYKDGIHIYFPYIVTSYGFQFKLRQQMMTGLKDILKNIENKNSIEDTYDEAVIKKNGMFLFMSTKPHTNPYKIYKIYNIDDELEDNDIKNVLDILSLRNKTEMTKFKNEKIKKEYDVEINIVQPKIINDKKINNNDSGNESDDDELNKYFCDISEQEMSKYINLLPDEHFDNYQKWLVIGAILYNTNPNFKEIFRDFSQKSDKYNEQDFEKMWNSYSKFNGEKVTFATLVDILKKNNLMNDFKNIKNKYKDENEKNIRENRFRECIKSNKKFFDKKSPLNIKNMYVNNKMLCGAILTDRHCPCYKGIHEKPYTTMNLINSGMLYQYCESCKEIFPSDGVKLEMNQVINIFGNGNTINNINNFNGKNKKTIDKYILDKHIIFEDDELNKLMINSLKESHKDIADVIYYLYKNEFNCTKNKEWYYYRNNKWNSDGIEHLRYKIMNEIYKKYEEMIEYIEEKELDDKLTDKIEKIINKIKSISLEDNLIKCLSTIYYVNNEEFESKLDQNPYIIGFTNGIYDLEKMEFRKGKPEDYISLSMGYEYDENQTSEYLDKIIREILPNDNIRNYVLKLFAYCMTGLTIHQHFYVLSGEGSNGKSIILELLKKTFGQYYGKISVALVTQKRGSTESASSALKSTDKKRIIALIEPDDDDKLNIGILKELTGSDTLTARELYKGHTEFIPRFKLFLICNKLPQISANADFSVWRRIRNIKFTSKFVDNPDPNKTNEYKKNDNLQLELDKLKIPFVNMLLKYYYIYIKEGLKDIEEVIDSTEEYKKDNNIYEEYFNEFIIKTDNNFDYIIGSDLRSNFELWIKRYKTGNIYDNKTAKKKFNELFKEDEKVISSIPDVKSFRGWKKYKMVNINDNSFF